MIVWILVGASLSVLLFGLAAFRIHRSQPLAANIAVGSMGLLYTAWQAQRFGSGDWVAAMVFLITMLLAGRALGSLLRARRDPEIRKSAWLMSGAAASSIIACAATAWPLVH